MAVHFVISDYHQSISYQTLRLIILMPAKRLPKSSLTMTRKKSKLSHKRLQTMINQNPSSDLTLENYEGRNVNGSDLRTQKEREALLTWVYTSS
jgi:hypothetical protein